VLFRGIYPRRTSCSPPPLVTLEAMSGFRPVRPTVRVVTEAPQPGQGDREVQAEQRDRRCKRPDVVYGERFDLLAEVHDICETLAGRVCSEPNPRIYGADVADLADAVHKLVVAWARRLWCPIPLPRR